MEENQAPRPKPKKEHLARREEQETVLMLRLCTLLVAVTEDADGHTDDEAPYFTVEDHNCLRRALVLLNDIFTHPKYCAAPDGAPTARSFPPVPWMHCALLQRTLGADHAAFQQKLEDHIDVLTAMPVLKFPKK